MEYTALYRKFRPTIFQEIVGQEHITKTLRNQIIAGRVGHAYLFNGGRGTGKTTSAKILARVVNCLNPQEGEPCNECEICKGIQDGSIMDVVEIDAASNNGVDNIRELREEVNYVATQTKYRVFIIDEVHMLSTGAFNALLKTLEEPPAHVIFILATTEAHKIPETILSRCQRFDFKRITPSDIIVRMKEIATADGINISEDAYLILSSLADGSMRDGLSILERCVSASGNNIDRKSIQNVLGIIENEILFELTNAVNKQDTQAVMTYIDSVSKEGKDLNVFCDSLIKHFRDLMICKVAEEPKKLIDTSDDVLVKLTSQAENCTYEKLSNAVTLLTKAKADAKWVKNPRIIYELALMKLTRPELDSSNEAMLDRLSWVEEKAKNGIVVEQKVTIEKKEKEEEVKKTPEISARLFAPIDVNTLTSSSPIVKTARNWEKIANQIQKNLPFLGNILTNHKISIDAEGILLLFENNERTSKNIVVNYLEKIQEAFLKYSQTDYKIKPVFLKDVENVLINFWELPDEKAEDIPKKEEFKNTLDAILTKFPEIVEEEESDDTFDDFDSKKVQQDIFLDESDEEFLDDDEIKNQYPKPALLINTSISIESNSFMILLHSSILDKSAVNIIHSVSSSCANCSKRSLLLATRTNLYPSFANRFANSVPIPELAPVITA